MKIIGITTYLTGIAHTHMVQEYLEKECRKRGSDVKIKTQGGLGIESELSEEDVAQADVAILAASVIIEGGERFEGKCVLHTDVDEAISHVEKLVDRTVAPVEGN